LAFSFRHGRHTLVGEVSPTGVFRVSRPTGKGACACSIVCQTGLEAYSTACAAAARCARKTCGLRCAKCGSRCSKPMLRCRSFAASSTSVTEAATGQQVLRSVTPGQQVVKIVNDALVEMLGSETRRSRSQRRTRRSLIMMVGLQGSGKTTTTAKIGKLPEGNAGQEGADGLARRRSPGGAGAAGRAGRAGRAWPRCRSWPASPPVDIARRAVQRCEAPGGYDVLMLDTAGRLHVDQALMDEMKARRRSLGPRAKRCWSSIRSPGRTRSTSRRTSPEQVRLTGVVLTRMDGDARGGAALSMRAVTGKPIKFAGTGEKLDCDRAVPSRARRRPHPRHGRYRLDLVEKAAADGPGGRGGRARDSACRRASST